MGIIGNLRFDSLIDWPSTMDVDETLIEGGVGVLIRLRQNFA